MPVAELSAVLLERDLVLLQHYAAKRLLPMRRVELHLAQVAMLIARTMGGNTEATLEDFLFKVREPEPESDAELGAAVLAGISGRRVIHLRKRAEPQRLSLAAHMPSIVEVATAVSPR